VARARGFLLVEESSALEDARELRPVAPTRLAEAHESHFRGEYAEAARAFEAATAVDSTDAPAWIGLAHSAFATKDWSRAANALRRAAALGALDAEQRLDVESAYPDPSEFGALLSALRARVAHRVFDVDARLVLGYFEAGLGETQAARDDLLAVLRRSRDDVVALCLLGRTPSPAALLAKD
jgi:thioredoxin-like negative regulator of GroEL